MTDEYESFKNKISSGSTPLSSNRACISASPSASLMSCIVRSEPSKAFASWSSTVSTMFFAASIAFSAFVRSACVMLAAVSSSGSTSTVVVEVVVVVSVPVVVVLVTVVVVELVVVLEIVVVVVVVVVVSVAVVVVLVAEVVVVEHNPPANEAAEPSHSTQSLSAVRVAGFRKYSPATHSVIAEHSRSSLPGACGFGSYSSPGRHSS